MNPETTIPFPTLQLTPEQRLAATSTDHSVAATAGAGAGKTRVLVARYLSLLHKGAMPSQIVAITFTNKAAEEMRQRVTQEVQKVGAADPRSRLWLLDLPTAPIVTMHALASRLLRRYPLAAKTDPSFRQLPEYESASLLREAAATALQEWLVAGRLQDGFLEEFGSKDFLDSLCSTVIDLRNRGEVVDDLIDQAARPPVLQPLPPLEELAEQISTYINIGFKHRSPKLEATGQELCRLLRMTAEAPLDTELYSDICEILLSIAKETTQSGQAFAEYLDTVLPGQRLLQAIGGIYHQLLHPQWSAVLALLRRTLELFSERKAELGALDFSDLIEKAIEILGDSILAKEIRSEWRWILVDEYQDTDFSQQRLISLLCGEELLQNLFVCGDAKQSIYGFRGAVVHIFAELQDYLRVNLGNDLPSCVSLQDNFRSRNDILAYINQAFAGLMPGYQPMQGQRPPLQGEPAVELLLSPGDKVAQLRENESQCIARRLLQMVRGEELLIEDKSAAEGQLRKVHWGDIAILLRTRGDIDTYELALRRAGIPVIQHAGQGFYSTREVLSLRVLLRSLLYPDDSLAFWLFLTSPIGGFDPENLSHALLRSDLSFNNLQVLPEDARRWRRMKNNLRRWRRLLRSLPLAELLEEICLDLDLAGLYAAEPLAAQMLANSWKFIGLVRDVSARNTLTPRGILEIIEEMAETGHEEERDIYSEGSEVTDAVRLMTVHAAKGLEFPVVVLPDLLRKDRAYRGGNRLFYNGPGELLLPSQFQEVELLKVANKEADEAEKRRLLYVALTRAEDYLILCGPTEEATQGDRNCWWSLLRNSFEPAREQGLLKVTRDMSDLPAVDSQADQVKTIGTKPDAVIREDPLHCLSPTESKGILVKPQERTEAPSWELTPGFGGVVSVTALLNYQLCPRLYYLQSHLRLTPPYAHRNPALTEEESGGQEEAGEDKLRISEAVRFGSLIHKLCEQLTHRLAQPWQEKEIDALTLRYALEYGYLPQQMPEVITQSREILGRFWGSALMETLRNALSYSCELPLNLLLPSGVMLRGIVDLVIHHQDGTLGIVDYKTNRSTARRRQALADHYRLQMHLYAYGIGSYYQKPLREASLYLLRGEPGTELLPTLEPSLALQKDETAAVLASALQEADEMALKITRGWQASHFPAHPRGSESCKYCGYSALCHDRATVHPCRAMHFGKRFRSRPVKVRHTL